MFTCIDTEKRRARLMRDDLQDFLSEHLGHPSNQRSRNSEDGQHATFDPIPSRAPFRMSRTRWELARRTLTRLLTHSVSQLWIVLQILKARTWRNSLSAHPRNP